MDRQRAALYLLMLVVAAVRRRLRVRSTNPNCGCRCPVCSVPSGTFHCGWCGMTGHHERRANLGNQDDWALVGGPR